MAALATRFEIQSGVHCDARDDKRELKRQNSPTELKRQNSPTDAPTIYTDGSDLDIASTLGTDISELSVLSKHQAIALCSELLDGFSTSSFQDKIHTALKNHPGERFFPARIEIALSVQQDVLPRYGFQGNVFGVVEMVEAIAPYFGSSTVLDLVNEIDEKLGLPKNSTVDMVKCPFPKQEKHIPHDMPWASRHKTISLCAELLDGFSTHEFQEELRLAMESSADKRFVPGRVLACLRIQKKILPKYGFPGNELGICQMMASIAPHISDWCVRDLVEAIDEKLGLPRDTTANAIIDAEF